jgi:hypothetical protein
MKSFLCCIAFLCCQSVTAGNLFSGTKPSQFELAEPLSKGAMVGRYPIWQGENKWQIFEISARDSAGGSSVTLGDVRVFQAENKKLFATMLTSGNLTNSSMTDWLDEPCKRDDLLFKASIGGKFSNINCITINHFTRYLSNPSGQSAKLYAYWKDQGVDIPPTVLNISVTRYGSSGRLLVVQLNINPELFGFPRDAEPEWGRSSWHISQSANDPKKEAIH